MLGYFVAERHFHNVIAFYRTIVHLCYILNNLHSFKTSRTGEPNASSSTWDQQAIQFITSIQAFIRLQILENGKSSITFISPRLHQLLLYKAESIMFLSLNWAI